ncbi:MAG: VWA domain-containing protein [Planctomycetes bacterium]|nr:VWA domain-containing protein [Planctomycetota bacterium]
MSVTFLAPHWLWLLSAVPLLLLVRPRARIPGHALLRAIVFVALVTALARPVVWTSDASERAVFVVDASASSASDERELASRLQSTVQGLPRGARASLVLVGGEPARWSTLFDHVSQVAGPRSSLSAALDAALLEIPAGARGSVTLLTDARATDRRFGDALIAFEERGIPLHVAALPARTRAAHVSELRVPRLTRVGHSSSLEITLVGDEGSTRVTLSGPEGEIGASDAVFLDGRATLHFDWEPRSAGFVALEARAGEHSLRRLIAVQEPLNVLYLGQRVQGGAARLADLVGPGLRLEGWAPSDSGQPPELERFDLVIVDDMPAETLGAELQRALVAAIRDRGLGLLASGGEAAFGPGGYHDSLLAEALPVEAVQKEEKRDPSTTLVLIIDTSGSMVGERIQLAKEVARLAMSRLLPHDKVGIVEFYGAKRWAAPIQPASNSIDLARAINRMDAGGGTVILPAIEEAFYGLQNVQTRYKHVLVITDGGVESGAFEPLLRRMADEGINVSTVLTGPEAHSEFLVNIANWGKGRFYSVPDRFNLPEVLLKQPTSSRLPSYKPGRFALDARGGSGWWGGVERAQVPEVAGYVETSARPGAEVLLEVRGERDPLLATWRYGLGRVTTFASEPVGPGTEPWRSWSGYGALLARVLSRTADDGRAKFAFRIERRGHELELLALRRPGIDDQPAARTVDADGATLRELRFEHRAPNVFVARWIAGAEREVRVLASSADDPREPLQRLAASARDDEVDELAVDPRRVFDLARAAAVTGGELTPLEGLERFQPRAGGPERADRLRELAPWLCAVALAVYLFDVFHRRRDRRRMA